MTLQPPGTVAEPGFRVTAMARAGVPGARGAGADTCSTRSLNPDGSEPRVAPTAIGGCEQCHHGEGQLPADAKASSVETEGGRRSRLGAGQNGAGGDAVVMTLSDVPEMIAAWRTGELSRDDVYALCLTLFAVNRVEDVLALLPAEVREPFGAALVAEFDNDRPAEDYMFFNSATGDDPDKVRIIEAVRAHFARNAERASDAAGGGAAQRLGDATSLTYAIGSEFAPDDPFGREVVELTAAGTLRYSRRLHGDVSTKVRAFSPARLTELLSDLERTSFPAPPQRGFQPGPGPATIAVAPFGASVSIDTMFAEGIDGYRELVEKLEDLLTRLRKDDPSLADDWGVSATSVSGSAV